MNRLGWAAGMSVLSYGVRIGIRVQREEQLSLVSDRLPPGHRPSRSRVVDRLYSVWVPPPSPSRTIRPFHLLYVDAARLARTSSLEELLSSVEADAQMYVALEARRRVFVHAGVVGWRGRAIVLPGRSLCGKSTLVAALLRAGATYYSDEYAVLDARGRVHPYARPLGIRRPGADERSERIAPQAFGARVGTRPLPVGLVLVTRYREGARFRPQALTAGQGALALLANTVAGRSRPHETMVALRQAVMRARILETRRGEAELAARSVLQSWDQ